MLSREEAQLAREVQRAETLVRCADAFIQSVPSRTIVIIAAVEVTIDGDDQDLTPESSLLIEQAQSEWYPFLQGLNAMAHDQSFPARYTAYALGSACIQEWCTVAGCYPWGVALPVPSPTGMLLEATDELTNASRSLGLFLGKEDPFVVVLQNRRFCVWLARVIANALHTNAEALKNITLAPLHGLKISPFGIQMVPGNPY